MFHVCFMNSAANGCTDVTMNTDSRWGAIPASTTSFRTTGDFDGDGKDDLAFWHADGTLWALEMFGRRRCNWWQVGAGFAGNAMKKGAYSLQGDYNGDGKSDIGFWSSYDHCTATGCSATTTFWDNAYAFKKRIVVLPSRTPVRPAR